MAPLFAAPRVTLMSFEQADAYRFHFPWLTAVRLPPGAVSLQGDAPPEEVRLIATTAALVARADLHPAFNDLLLRAAAEVHRPGHLFERPGEFPSDARLDFPLSPEAVRYLERGPSFLNRFLPFWAATLVERFVILLIPVIALLIPLSRLAPPAYRWQVRRRIYRWYRALREVERRCKPAMSEAERRQRQAELDEIERRVDGLKVPPAHADALYALKFHIGLVRERLARA